MKKFVLGLLVLLALTACTKGSSVSIEGQWQLVSYGSPSEQMPAAPDVGTSIEFDTEGRMSGNVGCNSFGGDYTVDGNKIKFGPVMSTLMGCIGPVGEQETATLGVMREIATFMLNDDILTITSADGSMAIVLERK